MSLYPVIPQMAKMLRNLDGWLEKAAEHAKAKSFDVETLLVARLAPDQFPLLRQIQAACDAAKFAAARVAGKEPPKHPDTESTIAEARARIAAVAEYLGTFGPADFEEGATRTVALSFLPGKGMKGDVYLHQMAAPNFYFHVTTAYAILRKNGVDIGKRDYLGNIELVDL